MKTIIAGSRNITELKYVEEAIVESGFTITEIVSGGAKGIDSLGEYYGTKHKIPIKKFPANWKLHGKKAGPIRNEEMAKYAEALIAIWDGKSTGTRDMINRAIKKGFKVYVKMYEGIQEIQPMVGGNGKIIEG